MREIPIAGSEHVAIVDDADYTRLSGYRWYYRIPKGMKQGYPFAYTPGGHQYMHTTIMGTHPRGYDIDHKNRNRLDNRRDNLRVLPHWLNLLHRGDFKSNTHGTKGVYWYSKSKKWVPKIRVGEMIMLGYFTDKEEASQRRQEAEQMIWDLWEQGKTKEEIRHILQKKYMRKYWDNPREGFASVYPGVKYNKRRSKWLSTYQDPVTKKGKLTGWCNSPEEAHHARLAYIAQQERTPLAPPL